MGNHFQWEIKGRGEVKRRRRRSERRTRFIIYLCALRSRERRRLN
jgi:hypothetical protein